MRPMPVTPTPTPMRVRMPRMATVVTDFPRCLRGGVHGSSDSRTGENETDQHPISFNLSSPTAF